MSLYPASPSVLRCCSLTPFFLPSGGKSGGFETLHKRHREENFAETFEVFSLFSVLRNVITPKKHFQKKPKVADWSQTMPTAPSSSSKSWYCCRGYLCSLFLCAPPEFIFISAPCWGLVRKWGHGCCHFGPRSAHKKKTPISLENGGSSHDKRVLCVQSWGEPQEAATACCRRRGNRAACAFPQ